MRLFALRRWSLCLLLICVLFPNEGVRAAQPASDKPVASMSTPRYGHTATLLQDGRVLVTGGSAPAPTSVLLDSAEIYDPQANKWSPTTPMSQARGAHTAILLRDGRVLVVSGAGGELFDPATQRWTPTAQSNLVHYSSPSVLLADGSVLVAGGVVYRSSEDEAGPDCTSGGGDASDTAEIYHPATDTWQVVAALPGGRRGHTLIALSDGSAIAIGGRCYTSLLNSVERYDPISRQWQSLSPLPHTRFGHTATLLSDGRVLIAGGQDTPGAAVQPLTSVLIFDPRNLVWTTGAPLLIGRSTHQATVLTDGRIFVTGGQTNASAYASAAEIYDPRTDHWSFTGALRNPSSSVPMVSLADGRVLLVRGDDGAVEIYEPVSGQWRESEQDFATRVCFPTGYCVRGPILAYWQNYLRSPVARTGYPISDEFIEVLEDGKPHTVQYFERVRLEHHTVDAPTNLPSFQFGQFGRRIHPANPPVAPLIGARYFPETGHNVQGGFLDYWRDEGGILWFGYPLTEEFEEVLEDGKVYRVQYFERARFEYHPENEPPYAILLGHFGRRILAEAQPLP